MALDAAMAPTQKRCSESRVCVKNLPHYLTEAKLKEHFSAKGEVTDVKIIRTSDGQSRKFGFVGFRTEEEAKSAVKYFNKSFLDTSRLFCEMARAIGDVNVPRPWSRHSKGSSAYERASGTSAGTPDKKFVKESKGGANEEDPELAEFLDVMQPRSKTKLWANDTLVGKAQLASNNTPKAVQGGSGVGKAKESEKSQVHFKDDSGDDSDKEFTEAAVIKSEEDFIGASAAQNKSLQDETISDMEYLKKKVTKHFSDDDEESDGSEAEDSDAMDEEAEESDDVDKTDKPLAEELPEADQGSSEDHTRDGVDPSTSKDVLAEDDESVAETGRLFVRNLPYTASEEELSNLFGQYGELSQVHLVLDKETNRSKGYAYVLFMLPEAAVRALEELDKSIFQGRLLHILPAKRPPSAPEKDKGTANFKQEREAQRKKNEASGNTQAWNSLYMRPDTVAENVAKQYGISKREFLDPEAEDLAVRLALGETHIIAETKRALGRQGVNVELLEDIASEKTRKAPRSTFVILVKNLPFSTTEEDLSELFGTSGSLGRLILPPTRTLAIVEFLEASEARKAFKFLAYRRFKHVPLYLEWAPENLLYPKQASNEDTKNEQLAGTGQHNRVMVENQLLVGYDEHNDLDSARARSVFVKNLNFKTNEAGLRKHFVKQMKHGSLRKVTVKTKPSTTGTLLSMGFGFLEFDSVETAKQICKNMQGTVLEGHALILQLSHGDHKADVSEVKKPVKGNKNDSSTNIIVRNVAFEASRKDLKQLFSPFGQMKRLKLPKKFDGTHRGFAFVEFVTKQEAQNAFDALANTHLYGRHLVLEWAREGETLEELRAKTASQFSNEFGDNSSQPSKKRKLLSSANGAVSHSEYLF